MKRRIFVAALLLCLLLFTGCGGSSAIKSNLVKEDFFVYQDGEVVYTTSDFSGEDFYFEYTGLFDSSLISTKRGIKIGDDAAKIAEAYADTACSIYYDDMSDEEYLKYSAIANYADVMSEFAAYEEYWVIYEMWIVDGEVRYDSQAVLSSINDKPLDTYDECEWYQLSFVITNGSVKNVALSMMDFVDTEIF